MRQQNSCLQALLAAPFICVTGHSELENLQNRFEFPHAQIQPGLIHKYHLLGIDPTYSHSGSRLTAADLWRRLIETTTFCLRLSKPVMMPSTPHNGPR